MKVNTTRFGEIDIDENRIIDFTLGIPGFSKLKRYVLLDYKDHIKWLHAVDDAEVAFIVTDPFAFFHDYAFEIGDEIQKMLEIQEPSDIVILTIINASGNSFTINLQAPIVANIKSMKAAQIILEDDRYSFRTPLPSQAKEKSE